MTEEEMSRRSQQDTFFAEMAFTLQMMKQEAEALTQSLGLPMEMKYDILTMLHDQPPFAQVKWEKESPLSKPKTEPMPLSNEEQLLFPTTVDPSSLLPQPWQKGKLVSDSSGEQEHATHMFSFSDTKEASFEKEEKNLSGELEGRSDLGENTTKTEHFPLYPFQQRVYETVRSGRNVILQVPTGGGKTLAALLPFLENAAQGGRSLPLTCLYVVPMCVLTDQFSPQNSFSTNSVGNLTLTAMNTFERQRKKNADVAWLNQPSEDFQMETILTFCTIDQLLTSWLNMPYGRDAQTAETTVAKVFTSYLVLDEFHLYSLSERTKMLHMLRLLKGITPFVLMTATASSVLLQRLQTLLDAETISLTNELEWAEIAQGRKRTFWRSEKIMNAEEIVSEHYQRPANRCTLVVCNTTERAQRLYRQLERIVPKETLLLLLHNRFTEADRQKLSQEIANELGTNKWHEGEYSGRDIIVVATQGIEVGFDISVQVLHTEIAPANSLIQRAGRCARFGRQQGHVWVYPLPLRSDGQEMSLLPYDKTLCTATWKALERLHAQEVGIWLEQELINVVHTQEDELFVDEYEKNESQALKRTLKSLNTEDHSLSASLLQDIAQVYVLIQDDPNRTIQEAPWQWEGFCIHPDVLVSHWQRLQKRASQLSIPVCWEPILQEKGRGKKSDPQEKTVYVWQAVTNSSTLLRAKILAFPRQIACYDRKLGLTLFDEQQLIQEPSSTIYQSEPSFVSLSNDTKRQFSQQNAQDYRSSLLSAYSFLIEKEIHYAAACLEQEINLESGAIDKAIRQAIASNNSSKQNQTWQQWTRLTLRTLVEAYQGGWKDSHQRVGNPSSPDFAEESLSVLIAEKFLYNQTDNTHRRKALETWLYFLIGRTFQLSDQKVG